MPERTIPVIDLFAGPGGLGEGFSSLRGPDDKPVFSLRLSIEKDPYAHSTLELRAFYREFSDESIPEDYYEMVRGVISRDQLFSKFPKQAEAARSSAWHVELGKYPEREISQRVQHAIGGADPWVLIGGPPCQAYSVVGRSRRRGVDNYVAEEDGRQTLYREYLKVLADQWPAVFIMENVKGLVSAQLNGKSMFGRILADLSSPAQALGRGRSKNGTRASHMYNIYSLADHGKLMCSEPNDFVIEAERYGIPQSRHRIILVGVRNDYRGDPPDPLPPSPPVPVSKVLDGLPRLRSGLSQPPDTAVAWLKQLTSARQSRWLLAARTVAGREVYDHILEVLSGLTAPRRGRGQPYLPGAASIPFAADWFIDKRLRGVCNHESKAHMASDLHRYLYAACYAHVHGVSPKLHEFPADLMPAHANAPEAAATRRGMFIDRFRVQLRNVPGTTVTSHIHKDGHYYIHYDPSQCRSLTVREAARVQTFPDNYVFCGPRTEQFIQVGNAVPPLLARGIADTVRQILV